ncbi:MAG: DUF262 domain-containing protein [Methylomicrobium sp.]
MEIVDYQNIEEEKDNEEIVTEFPFDPNKISINIVPRTIGQLVDMLQYDEIIVPKFQRRPDLWNKKQKSRFIESLMLKLPIPLFYFAEGEDNKWLVIDGLQRISTLEHFILAGIKEKEKIDGKETNYSREPFTLEKLEFRKELNGMSWNDLSTDLQRRINTNQVTINLIGKSTPEVVQFNIFNRINQGSIPLNSQEIRTALFQGYRYDLLESLVSKDTKQGQAFTKATDGSVSSKRQDDLDFATRFIAFYLLGYKQYEPDMDSFMTEATKAIPPTKKDKEKIINNFMSAMELAYDIFDKNAFRKPEEQGRRKPINKPLFEVISSQFALLTDEKRNRIRNNKEEFLAEFRMLFSYENKEQAYFFISSISSGTASRESVKERHETFSDLIERFSR